MDLMQQNNVLEVKNLTIDFAMRNGVLRAVNEVDLGIPKGKVTALVGESGSGKSTLASALLNNVPPPGRITQGEVFYDNENILQYNKEKLRRYKWSEVSMVFQAAQNALNPVMTIKEQIIETVLSHKPESSEEEIMEKAEELLKHVRLEPGRVLNSYPHELSGGMKQRVMIAFSLLLDPKLVILDEPTTALDVITQDYIFNLLSEIHEQSGVTMLLLTHDIAIVAKVADRIGVMYAGHLVEVGDVYSIFDNPIHPYTSGLLKAVPSVIDQGEERKPVIGSPPDLIDLPSGCPFHPRCSYAKPICKKEIPSMSVADNDHIVFCHKFNNHDYQ